MSKRKKETKGALSVLAKAPSIYNGKMSMVEKTLFGGIKLHSKRIAITRAVIKYFRTHPDLTVTLASVMAVREIVKKGKDT